MFSFINSYIKALKYIIGIVRFNEDNIENIEYKDEEYLGLDGKKTIVRIFYSKNKQSKSIIIFPGASPYAENHPGMIMLGNALRSAGYNVFLPRIPNLKNLLIVKENVDWFAHCYKELLNHKNISNTAPMVVGLSYGGANLLKASMDKRMCEVSPTSILSYGTYYSIESSLKFFLTGKIKYNDKVFNIKPHEWGTIVIFYNFFKTINTKYDKNMITQILKYRIEDNDKEMNSLIKKLSKENKSLIDKILNGDIDNELESIIKMMMEQNSDVLNYLSPKNWAHQIDNQVFIIHGANDSMVPFTESTDLSKAIKNKKLLISFLYEHREISTDRGLLFKIKELLKMINFFSHYFRFNR